LAIQLRHKKGTGALTAVPGSPFANYSATGLAIDAIAISGGSTFLYVLGTPSFGGGGLMGFAIDAARGSLTPVPGSPFAVTATPSFIATVSLQ